MLRRATFQILWAKNGLLNKIKRLQIEKVNTFSKIALDFFPDPDTHSDWISLNGKQTVKLTTY
jgi:hypothetical protein